MTLTPTQNSFATAPLKAKLAAKMAGLRASLAARAELATLVLIVTLILLWAAAIATFGYPALILPALIAVPSILRS